MMFIRQGATHKVVLGPFVDVGDGFTPETGVALSTADEAEAILHDNGTVVDISGYTWAAITTADGYYHLTLQAGISGTVGHLTIVVQDDSVCLPVKADFTVLEEAVYDALFAASAAGPLQSTVAGRTLDVTAGGAAGVDWGNVENPTTAVDLSATDIQLCDTVTTNTDMRGTDNAALASVLGALADAAAAGDPTSTDTVMAYLKQLINTVEGSTGIPTYPAAADPANNVSLAEAIRAIRDDVTGLAGAAMRGTDSAALASVATEARLAELDAANLPADVDTLLSRITSTLFGGITSLAEWLGLIAGKQTGDATARTEVRATGAGSGTYDETTDSQEAIRDTAPLGTAMRGTDSAALASVATEARLAELDAANIPADLDAVLSDTNELQGDWTDGGRLDLLLDRLITELDTARAEPGQGAPAASAKIGAKVDYLYKAWRNKSEQTATQHSLYDDAGTTVDQKRAISDDVTTFTAEEVASGP